MPEEIGMAVLMEMRRVTKPNGKIVIVYYDVPRNSFSAFLGHRGRQNMGEQILRSFPKGRLATLFRRRQALGGRKREFYVREYSKSDLYESEVGVIYRAVLAERCFDVVAENDNRA